MLTAPIPVELAAAATLMQANNQFDMDGNYSNSGDFQRDTVRANGIMNLPWHLSLAGSFFFFLMYKMRQLAIAQKELSIVAATDSLTAVFNRGAFSMQRRLISASAGSAASSSKISGVPKELPNLGSRRR